jgi:hypothetical protein
MFPEILDGLCCPCGSDPTPHHEDGTPFEKSFSVRRAAHLPSPLDLETMQERGEFHAQGKDETRDVLFSIHSSAKSV